jgi:thiol-disulfide isomerase/thioredoxin
MSRIRPSRLVLALAALLAGAAPALQAQGADNVLRGFEPTGDWTLKLDGQEVAKARIYDSQRAQAILILTSELPSPVLVDRAGRDVSVLDLMKVAERPDGAIDLLADAVLEPAGGYEIRNKTEAHFRVAGRAAALVPRPWKLGPQTHASLLENPGYQWRAKRYEPDAAAISRLRGEKRDVRVLTFFGSWCPHCKEHVPYLLKIEQKLAGSRIRFDYYGLPTTMSTEPEAAKWKVDGVPTAILLVGGKEVGRIPTRSWANPELALDLLLNPPTPR